VLYTKPIGLTCRAEMIPIKPDAGNSAVGNEQARIAIERKYRQDPG
jgi:hypothetical protein